MLLVRKTAFFRAIFMATAQNSLSSVKKVDYAIHIVARMVPVAAGRLKVLKDGFDSWLEPIAPHIVFGDCCTKERYSLRSLTYCSMALCCKNSL